mmetsp:Transcript_71008/g.179149  ORF Transcript_71008/g.179149 Transcript_71008/m.179149 type:complete len:225 (-) Transcript_71008:1208-1882(-)
MLSASASATRSTGFVERLRTATTALSWVVSLSDVSIATRGRIPSASTMATWFASVAAMFLSAPDELCCATTLSAMSIATRGGMPPASRTTSRFSGWVAKLCNAPAAASCASKQSILSNSTSGGTPPATAMDSLFSAPSSANLWQVAAHNLRVKLLPEAMARTKQSIPPASTIAARPCRSTAKNCKTPAAGSCSEQLSAPKSTSNGGTLPAPAIDGRHAGLAAMY